VTIDRATVTAIVLAGGRSSRFGSPKLAEDLAGATILDHAVRAVAAVAAEVVLAGKAPVAPAPVDGTAVRLVIDEAPFAGPLAAVAGALRTIETELAIVAGGDMPGLVPGVLKAMLDEFAARPEIDAVVLHDGARRQVLPVALRVGTAAAAAAEALTSGDRSLVRFLDRLRCAELAAAEWLALDPEARTVLDVDVPADLDRIRAGEIH
jgi:molybdopterin-guanine dinucleotide biosynthesis protein A